MTLILPRWQVLVFHLVFINASWKIPVGYFYIAGINREQLAGLATQCLTALHEAGITVASFTCDGAPNNLSMAKVLGCSFSPQDLRASFPHPSTQDPVHFFLDAAHMLKLLRNTLGEGKVLLNGENKKI